MFELVWKIIEPNGNQPIKMKSFSTEEKRQDFIDTMYQQPGFVVVSINDADSHTVSDFTPGMRVRILKATHYDRLGKTGTVKRTLKGRKQVHILLDDGSDYLSFAWNLQIL